MEQFGCKADGISAMMKSPQPVHSRQAQLVCKICQKKYKYKKSFYRHKILAHRPKVVKAKICRDDCWSKGFYCPVCKAFFKKNENMKFHLRLNHENFIGEGREDAAAQSFNDRPTVTSNCTNQMPEIKIKAEPKIVEPKEMSTSVNVPVYLCKLCSTIVGENEREEHVENDHRNGADDGPVSSGNDLWNACFEAVNKSFLFRKVKGSKDCSEDKSLTLVDFQGVVDGPVVVNNGIDHCNLENAFSTNRVVGLRVNKSTSIIACIICGLRLLTKSGYRAHLNSHNRQLIFEQMSAENFSVLDELKIAYSSSNDVDSKTNNFIQCKVCSKEFKSVFGLQQHYTLSHVGIISYNCVVCKCKFSTQTACQKHIQIIHKTMPFDCAFCDRKFPGSRSYSAHLALAHKTKFASLYSDCNTGLFTKTMKDGIGDGFVEKYNETEKVINVLTEELETEDVEFINNQDSSSADSDAARLLITCDFCASVCENQEILKQHMLDNHAGGFCAFRCDVCEFVSSNRRRTFDHCRNIHGSSKHLKQNFPNDEEKSLLMELREKLFAKNIVLNIQMSS